MASPSNDYGQSVADSAMNTGNSAINSFNPVQTADKIKSNFSTLNNSQTSGINDFIQGYKNTIAGQPGLGDMYSIYGAQNNLPQLGQQATTLNNAVLKVPQQNLDLARGFNYSQGQVDQKTNQDLTKLQPLASAASNAYQTAQNLTNQQVGFQQTQNQYELQPVQAQQQMLNDQMNRQMTGFTTAAEAELNGLIEKMKAGVQLSTTEMSRANALASAEASYQSAQIANQNVIIPSSSTYLNTLTGKAYNPMVPLDGSTNSGGSANTGSNNTGTNYVNSSTVVNPSSTSSNNSILGNILRGTVVNPSSTSSNNSILGNIFRGETSDPYIQLIDPLAKYKNVDTPSAPIGFSSNLNASTGNNNGLYHF